MTFLAVFEASTLQHAGREHKGYVFGDRLVILSPGHRPIDVLTCGCPWSPAAHDAAPRELRRELGSLKADTELPFGVGGAGGRGGDGATTRASLRTPPAAFWLRGAAFVVLTGVMAVRIYAHLSWTTFARAPLITERVAEFLCRFLLEEATRHRARAIEIGVVSDHVHLLLELPATFDVPRMVQGLKGASARLANRDGIAGHSPLQWAQGYDLRSVGVEQLRRVAEYVRDQERRHGDVRPSGRA